MSAALLISILSEEIVGKYSLQFDLAKVMPRINHLHMIHKSLHFLVYLCLHKMYGQDLDCFREGEVLFGATGGKIFPTPTTFLSYAKMSISDSLIIFLAISSELTS